MSVGGRTLRARVASGTVRAALRSVGLEVDANDRVRPAKATRLRPGMNIVVQRVEVRRQKRTERLYFHETVRETDALPRGDSRIAREGAEGERAVVTRIVLVDGVEESRTVVSDRVVREPVDRIVEIGTAEPQPTPEPQSARLEPPPPPPPPRPESPPEPDPPAPEPNPDPPEPPDAQPPDPDDDRTWDRLAECESGGDWAANTGNGYYGGLQFALATWRGLGGEGYPHEHPQEVQVEMGRKLQEQAGWEAWPRCAAELGWT